MKKYWLPLLLGAWLSLPALAQHSDPGRSESASANPESPQTRGPDASKRERDELAIHSQKAMDELRALAEELKKRADKASGEAKAAVEQQLKGLQEEQKKLEKKFLELKAATARQWKELQDEIDRTIEQFNRPPSKPRRDAI
jgi:Skp family chaperone for outer membrane proteins